MEVLTYVSPEVGEEPWTGHIHLGIKETTERMCRETPILRNEERERNLPKVINYHCQHTRHNMPFLIKVHFYPPGVKQYPDGYDNHFLTFLYSFTA